MVVVPEPAVKGSGAFVAGSVDRAVGPVVEEGADEAFGFAVCLWSAGPGAEVAEAKLAAAKRVDRRAVGGAVVGEDAFDVDAVAAVVGDGALEEADRGGGFLVCEDLGVGEAAVVVDGDVDVLPADRAASAPVRVEAAWPVAAGGATADAFAGAALDPA
jgi:hypothetical protein